MDKHRVAQGQWHCNWCSKMKCVSALGCDCTPDIEEAWEACQDNAAQKSVLMVSLQKSAYPFSDLYVNYGNLASPLPALI